MISGEHANEGGAEMRVSAIFNALIDDVIFAGGAVVSGSPNHASFAVTTDDAVFFGSVATAVLAVVSATTDDVVFSGGASVVGSPASATFAVTTDNASFSGAASTGTLSGSISDADITRIVQAVLLQLNNESIAAAVLAALQTTAIPVNIKQVNSIPIKGAGVTGNTWGPL